jgi:DNA polymerase III sliding clamp (beta) subunit (PCNA family)
VKVTIKRTALVEAAVAVAKVAGRTSSLRPVLTCVKFEAVDDKVVMSATDLEKGIQLVLPATVYAPGVTCFSASKLAEWVDAARGDEVEVSGDDQITLKCGSASCTLSTQDQAVFPNPLETGPTLSTAVVNGADFYKAIRRATFAYGEHDEKLQDNVKYIAIELYDAALSLLTTDATQLSIAEVNAVVDKSGGDYFTLRPDQLAYARSLGDGEVTLKFSQGSIHFERGENRVVVRLVNAKLPKWSTLKTHMVNRIPKSAPRVSFVTADLRDAVRQSMVSATVAGRIAGRIAP